VDENFSLLRTSNVQYSPMTKSGVLPLQDYGEVYGMEKGASIPINTYIERMNNLMDTLHLSSCAKQDVLIPQVITGFHQERK